MPKTFFPPNLRANHPPGIFENENKYNENKKGHLSET
jgi:hypothetical protein